MAWSARAAEETPLEQVILTELDTSSGYSTSSTPANGV